MGKIIIKKRKKKKKKGRMENGIDSPANSCSLKIPVQVTLLNSIRYSPESLASPYAISS